MKKLLLSIIGAFLISNIIGTLIAKFILSPMLNEHFGPTLRLVDDLEFPSLLGGYLLLSILMTFGYRYFKFSQEWKNNGIVFGILCGGMCFLSDHLITAGWSILPPLPMLISGVLDILSTLASGLFIAYIYRNEQA